MNSQKNKIDPNITWPTTVYFTFKDLTVLNPSHQIVNITLRTKLVKAKENGIIAEIGALTGGKGRPEKVFAFTPITPLILNKAKAADINLVDSSDKLVNIVYLANSTASDENEKVSPLRTPSIFVHN
jgi:hypothetical protein